MSSWVRATVNRKWQKMTHSVNKSMLGITIPHWHSSEDTAGISRQATPHTADKGLKIFKEPYDSLKYKQLNI